ncbi:acyl-CoA dehydrogenase family protein [Actinokineospora enzanensis]|uniref:acyl-CoA dehydrogenase family protein n=1 Tax=Actinokineospora enzanensis TaxID=155975 RepID=UPI000373C216|nr:acyl-CoA dehydrogenase family protein [Actinokineospora enzanensis]
MDLRDGPDEASFRTRLRHWLATAVPDEPDAERAARRWQDREFVRGYTTALWEAGYAGLGWPREYGGQDLPIGCQAVFLEETARRGAAEHAGVIGVGMVGPTVIAWGTPEQRARFLPGILSGDTVFCQGFSESEAGSDLAAVRTRAIPDGDGYRLDGGKLWSSYAPLADHCLVLARTDPDATGHAGLSCLLVDLASPGVEVRPLRQITGASDFAELRFDGVRVPAAAVVGPPGDGWKVAMTTLAHERGTFGFTLTARLEVQLDRLMGMARDCGADDDPLVRDELVSLWVELAGLRWTNLRSLTTLRRTGSPGPETGIVKLRWSRANQRLAHLAVRVADAHGGPWRAYWRTQLLRSRGNTLEGGTSEILRDIVAHRVLRLPKSR